MSVLVCVACGFSAPGKNPTTDGAPGIDAGVTFDAIGSDAPEVGERRKEIAISGDAVGETLSNFPLYLVLVDDADLRDHAAADGSDIFFVAADGATPLDHEIERWDPETGSLIAWVGVPLIDNDAGATLFVRYGTPEAAVAPDPAGVFQEGFEAVFHMNNDPDTPIVDSTGARDGIAHDSMDATDLVAGKLGLGLELDGDNDIINFDNPFVNGARNGEHTISGWVSQENSDSGEAFVVLGSGGATNRSRFIHTRFTGGVITTGLYSDDFVTDQDIQDDGFKLVHWIYDNQQQTSLVYVDGVLADGPHIHNNPADTQGTPGRIGNAPGGGNGFGPDMGLNGIVDEVRIASTVRSDAWIAAEFANQNDPGNFYSVGPEELQ